MNSKIFSTVVRTIAIGSVGLALPGRAQTDLPVLDLPLPPWGFASRQSLAPTFLAERVRNRLFVFPIIVGQKRTELAFSPFSKGGAGRPERVALTRRSGGMSPSSVANDDREGFSARTWRLQESDSKFALTRFSCEFVAVAPSQRILSGGKPVADWTPGKAELTLYPGNAAPFAEGLIAEMKLTNVSDEPQTYFVDALTMIESETLDLADPGKITSAEGSTLTLTHNGAGLSFVLLSDTSHFPRRAYRVTSAYFGEKANLESPLVSGGSSPVGALSPELAAGDKANWGLLRVDNVTIAPHGSQTIRFCVGVSKSAEEAQDAAGVLLGYASDTLANGKPRDTPGLFSLAQEAHRNASKKTVSPTFDLLLSRTFVTTPLNEPGRVGTPGRTILPTAFSCAALATGWASVEAEIAISEASLGLSLLPDLPLEKRGEGLLALLTSVDALPPDIHRATTLIRHTREFSRAAKSLSSPLPFLANVLLEKFALETGAESSEVLRWQTQREKGTPLYLASLLKPASRESEKSETLTNAEFALHWLEWIERGDRSLAIDEGKRRLAKVEKEAQAGSNTLDTIALIPLYHLLNTPGTVAAGRTIWMIHTDYDPKKDTLKVSLRPLVKGRHAQVFVHMGKPNTSYRLTGFTLSEAKTDENGVLVLPLPDDPSTQVVEVSPSP